MTIQSTKTLIAMLLAALLVAASCANDDTTSADQLGTDQPATDEPDVETPTTASTAPEEDPPAGETGSGEVASWDTTDWDERWLTAEPLPCAEPAALPSLQPADPDAPRFPAQSFELEPGRYSNGRLGLDFALDAPDHFTETGAWSATFGLFGERGDQSFILQRIPAQGFIIDSPTEEDFARGIPGTLVDFDAWLAQDGVTVVSDTDVIVGGYPARQVLAEVDEAARSEYDDVPFTSNTTIQLRDHVHRLFVVDVDGGLEPMVIQIDGPDDPDFVADMDAMIETLAIGEVGPSLEQLFTSSPWDLGNEFSGQGPVLVAPCTVSALAFGGVQFDLTEPTVVSGIGSELWIKSPSGSHLGFLSPAINIVAPEFAMAEGDGGGDFGPPSPGLPVETIDDAIAELEANGYVLSPIEDDVELLGSAAVGYDFRIEGEPWVWFPRGNGLTDGFGWASEDGEWEGTMYLADTDFGIIIASVGGEIDTGDVEDLRGTFATFLETLRPIGG